MPHPRPRHAISVIYCVSPVFAIYAICVMRYPPNGRLISREDAHPLYPRYPRVLNYMLLFTAHSPTNLCEKGWGYHCCVLVWLLALFAKLNRFFRKKSKVFYVYMYYVLCYEALNPHKYTRIEWETWKYGYFNPW